MVGEAHGHDHGNRQHKDYVDPKLFHPLEVGEFKLWSFYRAVIAEFVTTFLFLYVAVAAFTGHKRETAQCDGVGLLGIALAFGGMIFIMFYCITGISGGHINPAVTFAMLAVRRVSLLRAVAYMVAQCLGGICGVALVKALMKHHYTMHGGGANSVAPDYSKGAALGAEIVGTFLLVYTVFSATHTKGTARDPHVTALLPLPIGFAVFTVHLATIPITGTGINPARSFAAAVVYNNDRVLGRPVCCLQWIFWVGPFIGALLTASYHKYVLRASSATKSLHNNSIH